MLKEMFFLMISVRIGLIKWMDWRNLLDIMNIMVDEFVYTLVES